MIKKRLLLAFTLLLALNAFAAHPKRQLRGVWIATVANIDWPSKRGLSADTQKEEMVKMLDEVASYNMNTIVFQIRPTADAFYKSKYEPWSHWLTDKQGEDPGYDPLQFAIDECHKRGMYIHVWLNPYRVNNDTTRMTEYDKEHIRFKHPEWFVTYGKAEYFNPGLDEVRQFANNVVADIVTNYDIDAIHMDDYFYPYKIAGQEFPDEATFKAYPRGFTDKEEWRRDNVNKIICEINQTIKSIKPWVEFGISPFAIWRNDKEDPRGSKTKGGTTNYDGLYADILKWQQEKWIDYVLPQLYFNIGYEIADYAILADWWSKYNYGANVYAGLAPYRVNKTAKQKAWHSPKELVRQIQRNAKDPNLKGEIYFSAKSLFSPKVDLKKRLIRNEYKYLTLSPENPRVLRIEAEAPCTLVSSVDASGKQIKLSWERGKDAKRFVVYAFPQNKQIDENDPQYIVKVTGLTEADIPYNSKYRYAVSALSPSHTESSLVYLEN